MTRLTIRPLTPDLWPAFEDLFGANGACGGCWCMWWRTSRADFDAGRSKGNKAAYKRLVQQGPPPGLLAFAGDLAVGWCQASPRRDLPRLDRSRLFAAVDEKPVWSLSCFYIRKGFRGQGVASSLIAAAVKHAKKAGAPALEAYPWDVVEKKPSADVYTGLASSFAKRGFTVVARRAPHRPVMRHSFSKVRTRKDAA
jgi:GNAT superfamily N-acetyltransferase